MSQSYTPILPTLNGPAENVYNFSIQMTQGFLATLSFTDANAQPIALTNATFTLTRLTDNVNEFKWSISGGQITNIAVGKLQINVPYNAGPPATGFIPSVWQTAQNQYPWQNYSFTLVVTDSQSNQITVNGFVTIYQF